MRTEIRRQRLFFACSNRELACVLLVREELDALVVEDGGLGRQRSGLFVLLGELARLDLAGLDVGLIEAVDSDHRSCNRGCDLPAEELLTDVVLVQHLDADDGEPSFLQRVHLCVLRGIGCAFQADVNEEPVFAIDFRRADLFTIHRDNAFTLFASRLGKQLFEPCTQVGNTRRGNECDLVFAGIAVHAHDDSQNGTWIVGYGNRRRTGLHHLLGTVQEFLYVYAHHR